MTRLRWTCLFGLEMINRILHVLGIIDFSQNMGLQDIYQQNQKHSNKRLKKKSSNAQDPLTSCGKIK